jgi:hypothetical protein
MKIAPEIDRLMWTIAETGQTAAADDFNNRFPELKTELSRRVELMQELRKAKSLHINAVPTPPAFHPSAKIPRSFGTAKGPTVAIALLAGAAIAVASYVVVGNMTRGTPTASGPDPACQVPLTPPPTHMSPPAPKETEMQTPASGQQGKHVNTMTSGAGTPDVPAVQNETTADPMAEPQHVRLDGVPLKVAVKAIGSMCHIDIELAPGVPDQQVVAHYDGVSGRDIITDMGQRYGFAMVEDGKAKVLLIPVAKK